MIAGVRQRALAAGLMMAEDFDRGVADLARCAEPDGVFVYTFFRATAHKPPSRFAADMTPLTSFTRLCRPPINNTRGDKLLS